MHRKDISLLKGGVRIRFSGGIDLDHYGRIDYGELGTVVAVEKATPVDIGPTVFIRLDKHHCELQRDDNEIWIFPECDDVLECIEIVTAEPVPATSVDLA
jgi:hypothetical protein